ncbi:hypothetical protein IAU60_005866 [Kwoniella sp. DSM 27419]
MVLRPRFVSGAALAASRQLTTRSAVLIPRHDLSMAVTKPLRLPSTTIQRYASSAASTSCSTPLASAQREPEPEPEPEAEPEPEPEPEPANQSTSARLKAMFKKYGWYSLGIYLALGLVDCGLVFIGVHALGAERISPVFDRAVYWYRVKRHGEDEAARMKDLDVQKKMDEAEQDRNNKEAGIRTGSSWGPSKAVWAEFALAYAIHKTALLPVRAGLTVAWTPKFVAWLTRRGWVGKGGLTRAATHAQGKVRNASDRVKERVKRQ